jgi:hypothetical protein
LTGISVSGTGSAALTYAWFLPWDGKGMSLMLRVLLSILVVGVQAALILVVRRMSIQNLMKWGFFSYRGEEMFAGIRRAGEELRQDAQKHLNNARFWVTMCIVLVSLPLDVLLILIWSW